LNSAQKIKLFKFALFWACDAAFVLAASALLESASGKTWAVRSAAANVFPEASSSQAEAAIRLRCGSGQGSTGCAQGAIRKVRRSSAASASLAN
jgi:hypothetical protein